MENGPRCADCGAILTADAAGASRKLLNRGLPIEECLCLPCLASRFGISVGTLERKIKDWRAAGCMLFPQTEADDKE